VTRELDEGVNGKNGLFRMRGGFTGVLGPSLGEFWISPRVAVEDGMQPAPEAAAEIGSAASAPFPSVADGLEKFLGLGSLGRPKKL